jgi:hypothetical protein
MEKILPFMEKRETSQKIRDICAEAGVDYDTFEELVGEEFKQLGKIRKRGHTDILDDILARIYEEDLT